MDEDDVVSEENKEFWKKFEDIVSEEIKKIVEE